MQPVGNDKPKMSFMDTMLHRIFFRHDPIWIIVDIQWDRWSRTHKYIFGCGVCGDE